MSISRAGSQSGIFLPLSAATVLCVLFVIIGLGIDLSNVHRASVALTLQTEEICQLSAERPELHRKVAEIFQEAINRTVTDARLFGVQLISARLIMPTMPRDGLFPSASAPYVEGIYNGDTGAHYFRALALPSCDLRCADNPDCQSDCIFQGQVLDDPAFPATLWGDQRNAGNTVGCELRATVSSILFGRRMIKAKSVWKKKMRGSTGTADDPASLVVAVAPHAASFQDDARFSFESDLNLQLNAARRYELDPAGFPFFKRAAAPVAYTGGIPSGSYQLNPAQPLASDAEFGDLLRSCMNPMLAARNRFLQHLLERAGRNGELRRNTGLYLIGTQHRNLSDSSDLTSLPRYLNPPVELVRIGEDLMQRSYQLPYVFYNTGDHVDRPDPPAPLSHSRGFTNPFDHGTSELMPHHSLLVGQLRYCYQLYTGVRWGAGGGISAGSGIQRPYAVGLYNNNIPDFPPTINIGFEPGAPTLTDPYNFFFKLRPGAFSNGNPDPEPWDQECPWGRACTSSGLTRSLSATELVSSLGIIQSCPYQGPYCQKPPKTDQLARENLELRGDILGFLCHLKGGAAHSSCPQYSPRASFPAVKAPGLFPLLDPANQDTALPFHENAYSWPDGTQKAPRTLVILTHYVPSPDEGAAIRNLVYNPINPGSGPFKNTSIIVIYMPAYTGGASPVEHLLQQQNQLRYYFNINQAGSGADQVRNSLYIFSPYLEQYSGIFDQGSDQELLMRSYWQFLLNTDSDDKVEVSAGNIYHDILSKQIHF